MVCEKRQKTEVKYKLEQKRCNMTIKDMQINHPINSSLQREEGRRTSHGRANDYTPKTFIMLKEIKRPHNNMLILRLFFIC